MLEMFPLLVGYWFHRCVHLLEIHQVIHLQCVFFFFFLGLDQKDLGPTMCLFIVEETLAYMFHRYSIIFVLL